MLMHSCSCARARAHALPLLVLQLACAVKGNYDFAKDYINGGSGPTTPGMDLYSLHLLVIAVVLVVLQLKSLLSV